MRLFHADLDFVITGTGRAGTTFIARVFNELGIRCGHEVVFDHRTVPNGQWDVRTNLKGDASWCAVPYLSEFKGTIFHQMRDPLRVVSSWLAIGLFTAPNLSVHKTSLQFLSKHFGRVPQGIEALTWWVVEWNERCERYAHMQWNIERLDPSVLSEATKLLGCRRSEAECRAALAAVPTNENGLEDVTQLTWDELPDGDSKRRLAILARRYGYDTPKSRD